MIIGGAKTAVMAATGNLAGKKRNGPWLATARSL
jgi:hypothetical protein